MELRLDGKVAVVTGAASGIGAALSRRFASEGMRVVLADVEELCDRMAILHGGELRFVGAPGDCRARYGSATLEEAYLAAIA